jgi:signal transduction histidine kinase
MKLDMLTSGAHGAPSPDCRAEMLAVADIVERAMSQTRALMSELHPIALGESGLEAALAVLLRRLSEEHDLCIELNDDGSAKPLGEDRSFFLFRAIREILLNVVKHAGANRAAVSLQRDGNTVRVVVEDDGKGFLPAELDATWREGARGYGLYSISERIKGWNGTFEITGCSGTGSRLVLSIPLCDGSERYGTSKQENIS